jgi:hypothetical protein
LKLHKSLKISATLQKVCTKLSISAIAPDFMPTNQLFSSIGILPKLAMPMEGGRSAPNTKTGQNRRRSFVSWCPNRSKIVKIVLQLRKSGYSRFCELYRCWAGALEPVLRQGHVPGEKMFVDWAGQKVEIHNAQDGSVAAAHLFVAVLGGRQ